MTPNGLITRDGDYVIKFFLEIGCRPLSLYFTEEDCKRLEMFVAQRARRGHPSGENSFSLPSRATRWTVNFNQLPPITPVDCSGDTNFVDLSYFFGK